MKLLQRIALGMPSARRSCAPSGMTAPRTCQMHSMRGSIHSVGGSLRTVLLPLESARPGALNFLLFPNLLPERLALIRRKLRPILALPLRKLLGLPLNLFPLFVSGLPAFVLSQC